MHILHYVPNYLEPIGGREIFAHGLIKYLRKYGIIQSVLTNSKNGKAHIIPSGDLTIYCLPSKKFGSYLVLRGAFNILRHDMFDIIHIHGYGDYCADVVSLLKQLRLLSTPTVLTTHGVHGLKHGYDALDLSSYMTFHQRMIRLPHLIYDFTMGRLQMLTFSKIIVLSDQELYLLQKIGLRKDKVVKIPVAIHDAFFSKSHSNKKDYILYVGRIDKYKGLDTLALAIKELKLKGIQLKCLIVGKDYGYRSKFESFTKKLGIHDQIELKGFQRLDNLISLYSDALVTVLPSPAEGFPLTLVESTAVGTPYISTAVGAIKEFTESSNAGILIPVRNAKELANAIVTLLTDEDLWRRLSENGKKYAQCFTWQNIGDQYYQLYREIIVN
jgi:glycosyltransferase involved in cell wall biosynthesis